MPARTPLGIAVLLCLIAAAPCAVVAERLSVRVYTAADGLVSDETYGVEADSRGFLWIYTADGLSRFDGYSFTTYTKADGLPHRRVSDLVEMRSGEYYVGTASGLCRFDPRGVRGTEHPPFVAVPLGDTPLANSVDCLLATRDGALLCGTVAGLFRIEAGKSPARVDLGADGEVVSLLEDRWGDVWAGMAGQVRRVRPDGRVDACPLPKDLRTYGPGCIFEDAAGRLWACTRLATVVASPRTSADELAVFDTELPRSVSAWINGYRRTHDGTEWVAATSGLWRIVAGASGPSLEPATAISGICDREVWDLAEDRDGNLWLATTCGALRLDPHGFTSYGTADGLARVAVNSIFESRAGDLIVTTNQYGRTVHQFDGKRFVASTPRMPEGVEYQGWGWGQTVLQDREGAWWVPTGYGALRYPSAGRPEAALGRRPERVGPRNEAFRLFEDSRGDVWIVAIRSTGNVLLRWEASTGRVLDVTAETGLGAMSGCMSFAETRGVLWMGTSGDELLRYAEGRFERFTAEDGVPAGLIRALHVDDAGRLWIGSSLGGLARVDDPAAARPTFAAYRTAQGLASDNVWSVTSDAYGRIYLGLPMGVDRLDPSTGRVKHFTSADGLPKGSVQQAYRDRVGRLWFGTGFGVARLDPAPDREREPPRTLVTGLRAAGVARPVSSLGEAGIPQMELGPSENSVSVDFLGLGASLGEALGYQYRLEGADGDWTAPTVERTVTFANLSPGSYRFFVRAINTDGVVSAEPAVVAFTIAAPVWRRWWFVLSALAIVGLALYVAHRRRVARLLEIERVRTRIATDLHDDIGANLTRIAVLSEVASYRRGENGGGDDSIASIARISRESVTSMSDIVWAINPKRDTFRDLLRRMRTLADEALATQGVEVCFAAPDSDGDLRLGDELRRQIYLVFKEAVNNAARHSGCERVEIEVALDHGRVALTVSDDGRGFDPSSDSDGNGLANMRKRAGGLGSRLDMRSAPGEGTTVRLEVTLRRGHPI